MVHILNITLQKVFIDSVHIVHDGGIIPTITIRLDNELLEKINQSRDDKTVSTYCKNIISDHLNDDVHNVHTLEENESLKVELQHKTDMLKMCTERVQDLQKDLGFLQIEFQKMSRMNEQLLLSPAQEEISKKSWWQFWKK